MQTNVSHALSLPLPLKIDTPRGDTFTTVNLHHRGDCDLNCPEGINLVFLFRFANYPAL